MLFTIVIIVVFGLLLMVLETFIPGLVAGALGILCIVGAVALALTSAEFAHWPSWGRTVLACAIVAGSVVSMLVWMRFFGTRFGNRAFTLNAVIPGQPTAPPLATGTEGVALTELRPLGRADFGGQRHEVRCEDGFAPAGSRIKVTGKEPGNLLVRLVQAG